MAEFDACQFDSISVKQHGNGHYHEVSILTKKQEVLLLAKPRMEADAVELATELSKLLNIPMAER